MSRTLLASSRPLLAWLRADTAWSKLPLSLRARITWQAHWGSVNARLSEAAMQNKAPLADPMFIVGPWRSGTTVMHELLAAATGWPTPQTWQCMNACTFQLSRPSAASAALARPMDGLEIRADSPQEDEFALLSLGVDSAYRAFWMPARIGQLAHTLDPAWWQAHRQWLAPWETFLRGVAKGADAPLLLKSPNHCFRLPAIAERFPGLRAVWMARPAAEVYASNRKMWRAMFAQHGLTPERDATALDEFLAAALERSAEVLDWCARTLPRNRFAVVTLQALRQQPETTMRNLWSRIGSGAPLDEAALHAAMARTASGRIDRYDAEAFTPMAQHAIDRLEEAQSNLISGSSTALDIG